MKKLMLLAIILAVGCSGKEKQKTGETAQRVNPHKVINLVWDVPEDWVQAKPSSSMRIAEYHLAKVAGDPEDAVVVVFHFPSQGGTVEANIKRWAEQFKQPDGSSSLEKAKVEKKEINGLNTTIVDLSGTYLFQASMMSPDIEAKPNFRMIAAVVETEGGPWFFKLVGPQKTVSNWQDSFVAFLQSVKLEKTTS